MRLVVPIAEEWNHGFAPSDGFPYTRRPLRQCEAERDDFVTFSDVYTEEYGEPVWLYSWGNARWLRCPVKDFTSAAIRRNEHGGWEWVIEGARPTARRPNPRKKR